MNHCKIVIVYCCLLTSFEIIEGFSRSARIDEIPFGIHFKINKGQDIIAKSRVKDAREFFHLFNVTHIICFFAAKGKWPFIPPFMQIKVDQVSRTIFPQNDNFIRNYCRGRYPVTECHRPSGYHGFLTQTARVPPPPPFLPPTTVGTINTEVETFDPESGPDEELCICTPRKILPTPSGIIFFDRNHIANVSSETIQNTIEFLKGFLASSVPEVKKKKKTKIRITV